MQVRSAHCSVLVSAHGLLNELDSCLAFLFRFKDYCFKCGTLIKEPVKFLRRVIFPTWKQKHDVKKIPSS